MRQLAQTLERMPLTSPTGGEEGNVYTFGVCSFQILSTNSPHRVFTFVPADFGDASNRSAESGKSRDSRMDSIVVPTAPVAPTMATFGVLKVFMVFNRVSSREWLLRTEANPPFYSHA